MGRKSRRNNKKKDITFTYEMKPPGEKGLIGDTLYATTKLDYCGATWELLATSSDETVDGIDFVCTDVKQPGLSIQQAMELYEYVFGIIRGQLSLAIRKELKKVAAT